MIVSIPLPEYKPDQSVNSGVLLTAKNVYPAIDGYRPIHDIETITDALGGEYQGGISAIASDGDAYLIAGTSAGLYQLEVDGSWTSLVTGLSIAGRWRFTQFGNYIVAVNGDITREIDLDAGTASTIAAAPTFTSITVIGDYVVGGQSNSDITMVRWSAFRDHTAWTNGTDQAGEQPMLTGGAVQGIAGGEYGVVLQRERIVRMDRTGDATAPFQFTEISANYGCADAATIAQAGRTVFFYSDRGFMALDDGQVLKNIGSEKVDRTFAKTINRDDLNRIFTAVDPQNKLVMWGIPGSPGTIWLYNFELDRWAYGELNFTGVFPGFTTSVSLEDLPSLGYTNLDTMAISLDDPRWSGGNPRMYLVDEARKVGTLTGDTLAADFELGYTQLVQGRQARVRSMRPITDAVTGMTASINAKQRMGDTDNVTSTTTLRASGVMPLRGKGRYHKSRIRIAAGTDWDYFQGLEVECEVGGVR